MPTTLLRVAVCVASALILVSCRGDDAPVETTLTSDLSPVQVLETLLVAIDEGRFEDTTSLTDGEQAGLITLAEGADATDVVESLADGGREVTSSFWSGFAQTLDPTVEPDQLTMEAGQVVEEGGSDFVYVEVSPPAGESQTFVLRRDPTWKVDVLSTFAPVLAERLVPAVEGLLASANTNATTVLKHLNASVPSLRVALENPNLDPAIHQSLVSLIERITRAG